MDRQRAALVLLAIVMLVVGFIKGRRYGTEPEVTASFASDRPVGWVQVGGMVAHVGIYPVYDNKMTNTAIKMAEPLCEPTLSPSTISELLAMDGGVSLLIRCSGKDDSGYAEVRPLSAQQRLVLGLPLSVSRATQEELLLVPGIGPVLADRIVQYRHKNGDFGQVEELLRIEGVGEKTLVRLSPFIKP